MKYLVLAVALLMAGFVGAQDKPVTPEKPAVTQQDPSPKWLSDYDDYMALVRVITQMKQESGLDKLEAKMSEKAMSLRSQIPQGFEFDPATKKFTKTEPARPVPQTSKPTNGDKK